jgi:aromatic amino acid aminotransferase I
MPSPEYFPFDTIKADILVTNRFPVDSDSADSQHTLSWLWNLFSSAQLTEPISIPKYADKPQGVDLATSLQYSITRGLPPLTAICTEISSRIYRPAYANFITFAHVGNTDGWAKTVITLCNPGEGILCEEWTYPSAIAAMQPYGVSAVPVQMDDQGMCSDALRELLASWDVVSRGMTRCDISAIHFTKRS